MLASLLLSPPQLRAAHRSRSCSCYAAATEDPDAIVHACLEGPAASLPEDARARVEGYVRELLRYNERTNVYSKSAYAHLPFHVHDSIVLGQLIAAASSGKDGGGVLDLGSGSGLPSVVAASVNPELPVYAVESKSRKTRFLTRVARKLDLPLYTALTRNVHEYCASWVFDVDVVTAKAFKPLPEVVPIARRAVMNGAMLHIPISEAQVTQYELAEKQLVRQGEFLYFREQIDASHGAAQRKLVRPGGGSG